ncbi:COG3650 family protein [Novosphingobium sp. CF614]|uniref:COG3650 family protein n=1 Tax=Novosphingobium sp. CF614 TaxID=1884364 RepID=UPI0021012951|nr:hypothetical protein [Novosphingobium sp. CF614]
MKRLSGDGLGGNAGHMAFRPLPSSRRALVAVSLLLAACHSGGDKVPGNREDHQPWHDISESETVRFTGTEPFWSGQVSGSRLTYSTPDNLDGETIKVSRFAGRGGLSFSGQLAAGAMTLAITPGQCNDGMSDRRYPYMVTLQVGGDLRKGCGWTDRQPHTGGE